MINTLQLTSLILTAALIAITGFTYSYILTQPGEIFGKLYLKLDILFKSDERGSDGKGLHPLFKMSMACPKCVSGQMALWIFIILNYQDYLQSFIWHLVFHILFIGTAIFFATIIKSLYQKHIEWN